MKRNLLILISVLVVIVSATVIITLSLCNKEDTTTIEQTTSSTSSTLAQTTTGSTTSHISTKTDENIDKLKNQVSVLNDEVSSLKKTITSTTQKTTTSTTKAVEFIVFPQKGIIGENYNTAKATLENSGFIVCKVLKTNSGEYTENTVYSATNFVGGESYPENSTVILTVWGPAPATPQTSDSGDSITVTP